MSGTEKQSPQGARDVATSSSRLKRLAASEQPAVKRGSKQALQKHLGLFRDDQDVEAVLADLRARREAGNAEGGE
jgi:hypothetical protein